MSEYSARQKAWIKRVGPTSDVALGWPREAYSRPVKGHWKCHSCGHEWLEYTTGSGTFTEDDFLEEKCEGCDGMNTHLNIEDDWTPPEEHSEFSFAECDLCGCPLGGARHPATILFQNRTGTDNSSEPVSTNYITLTVCTDCVMYLANGDVPDDEYLEWV